MSVATEELERRAIELYTDLNEVFKATPEGIDKEFLVFKAQHDIVNQMRGNTQC